MFSYAIGSTCDEFCKNATFWRLHVDGSLVRFLVPDVRRDIKEIKKEDTYDFEEDIFGRVPLTLLLTSD